VFEEQLLVELDITTGLRSGELRGLAWPMVDLKGKRIHVVSQATRRRADDLTKTPHSIRTVPIPDYLIPDLIHWKSVCPDSYGDLVFPGLAGTLMSEAGVPPKRAQEILGHADVRTTLAIYTHTLKRKHDDSANRMADIAGLSGLGNKRGTVGSVEDEETELSACSNGSLGWNRTNDQRINRTDQGETEVPGRKKSST
jgi:integrase